MLEFGYFLTLEFGLHGRSKTAYLYRQLRKTLRNGFSLDLRVLLPEHLIWVHDCFKKVLKRHIEGPKKANPTQQLENPPWISLAPKYRQAGKRGGMSLAPKFRGVGPGPGPRPGPGMGLGRGLAVGVGLQPAASTGGAVCCIPAAEWTCPWRCGPMR